MSDYASTLERARQAFASLARLEQALLRAPGDPALVVHPLNEFDIWQDCDPGAARSAMTSAPAPEEGVLVGIPIGRGAFDSLFDLGPGIKPPPL